MSSSGDVFSHVSGRYLHLKPHSAGYLAVSLTDGKGNAFDLLVHRIVCAAFHGEAVGDRTFVNHIDGNKRNNKQENLEWCTRSENMNHAVRTGLMTNQRTAVREANRKRARPVLGTKQDGSKMWFPSVTAARKAGYAKVSDCLLGNRKTAGGATWEYA